MYKPGVNTLINTFHYALMTVNVRVRDPVTRKTHGIQYLKLFGSEYFNNKSVTQCCDAQTLLGKYCSERIYS